MTPDKEPTMTIALDNVLAFENAGEWYYVAADLADLAGLVDEAGGALPVLADQCEDCGSFGPDGEPGQPYEVREVAPRDFRAVCPCCDRQRRVTWHAADLTVFP